MCVSFDLKVSLAKGTIHEFSGVSSKTDPHYFPSARYLLYKLKLAQLCFSLML